MAGFLCKFDRVRADGRRNPTPRQERVRASPAQEFNASIGRQVLQERRDFQAAIAVIVGLNLAWIGFWFWLERDRNIVTGFIHVQRNAQ